MGARGEPALERAHAVLEERAVLGRDARLRVGVVRVRRERRRLEERDALVEHAGVAGGPDVVRDRVRQPDEVVRAAGARPAAARRVPPVLDVALEELPRRRPQQVLAHERRPRQRERHRVLQLVAEAERAAGLVVAGAGPDAGSSGPGRGASGSRARRRSRRASGPGPRRGCPPSRAAPPRARRRPPRRGRAAATSSRTWRHVPPLADQEHEAPGLARLEGDRDLKRRARDRAPPRSEAGARPGRAPPGARASRSGRGRRCGRRSPSGAARSRGRRPRGPRTRGSTRSWRGPPRSPRPAPSRRAGSGRPAAVRAPTRCRRRRRAAAGRRSRS